jgi:hypothetical protein
MINRKDLYILAAVLALLLFGNSYLSSLRDSAKQEQLRADVKQQTDAINTKLEKTLSDIQRDKQTVKTSPQIAQAIPRYVEGVHPIVIVPGGVPTNTSTVGSNIPSISLPDAPSAISAGSLVIPSEQVPAYWKSVTTCAENSANLIACQGELPLQVKRAESAEKAMKGGSFWSKAKRSAIYLGIGAAAGYVAAKH